MRPTPFTAIVAAPAMQPDPPVPPSQSRGVDPMGHCPWGQLPFIPLLRDEPPRHGRHRGGKLVGHAELAPARDQTDPADNGADDEPPLIAAGAGDDE